jgi:hypothetical protein
MVGMVLRASTPFLIQKSAPPGFFPTRKPRSGKIELKRRLFLYEGAVESQNLAVDLQKSPQHCCLGGLVWGRHPFGFILASLVTQVAVEDVHSGQRATRGSATVGCF